MKDILESTNHRPYPIPGQNNWIMSQDWNELLFAHWPVPKEVIEKRIPQEFEVDTFDGSAWIGVVPFRMDEVGFRYIPFKTKFLELNVRTYVKLKDYSAVYFFSLDATDFLAVEAARLWFGLPYLKAQMSYEKKGDTVHYKSRRLDKRANHAHLEVEYKPVGSELASTPGSLEHFLTERYCLLSKRGNKVVRGDIHHKKWPLYKAEAAFHTNTMMSSLGIEVEGEPLLHYAKSITTVEWTPKVMPIQ